MASYEHELWQREKVLIGKLAMFMGLGGIKLSKLQDCHRCLWHDTIHKRVLHHRAFYELAMHGEVLGFNKRTVVLHVTMIKIGEAICCLLWTVFCVIQSFALVVGH